MQTHRPFFLGDRRRLVNLSTQPLFQLKLPVVLLLSSGLFALVFAAHTHAAYGRLISAGFEEAFLNDLASEIRFDYFVVSFALCVAWCLTMVGICLAATHHFLGPIVALKRRIAQIRAGHYERSAPIRKSHPLRSVSDELDALARLLSGEDLVVLEENVENAAPATEELRTELVSDEQSSRCETESQEALPPNEATPWIGWYARTAAAQQ